MWLFDLFFLISANLICRGTTRVPRSLSESPLDFEVTRVDFILMCQKTAGCVINSVVPDYMQRSAGSGQVLPCLAMSVCPNK